MRYCVILIIYMNYIHAYIYNTYIHSYNEICQKKSFFTSVSYREVVLDKNV